MYMIILNQEFKHILNFKLRKTLLFNFKIIYTPVTQLSHFSNSNS